MEDPIATLAGVLVAEPLDGVAEVDALDGEQGLLLFVRHIGGFFRQLRRGAQLRQILPTSLRTVTLHLIV